MTTAIENKIESFGAEFGVPSAPMSAPQAESMVNNAPRDFTDATWPVGSGAHQGDLILVRIEAVPASAKPRTQRQMALGNTQGSRHILEGGQPFDCEPSEVAEAIRKVCPKADTLDAKYVGPVFLTDDNTALRHPEHGHHCYPEAGMAVAVVYQKNLDALQREQRTQD